MADGRDILTVLLNRRELKIPSDAENFRYLKANWRGAYTIIRPSQADDTWKAVACFGNGDELVAATADELLGMIRHHYSPDTEGYAEMLMARLGRKYT